MIRKIPTLQSTDSAVYIDNISSSRTRLTRWLALDGMGHLKGYTLCMRLGSIAVSSASAHEVLVRMQWVLQSTLPCQNWAMLLFAR